MKITYIGHACILIETQGRAILTDPYISQNPKRGLGLDRLPAINDVLLTHGHGDHTGDVVQIAEKYGCRVIAPVELAARLSSGKVKAHPMNFGSREFEFGRLTMVPASHSSSESENGNIIYLGNPCGYVIRSGSKSVYFAGDTGLISDMSLLADEGLDAAFLPAGGNFTMDPEDAVKARRLIKARITVPIHYNTFPMVTLRAEQLELLEREGFTMLLPGEAITL